MFAQGDIQNCSVHIHVYLKWSKYLVRNNEKLNSLQNTHICGLAQATNFSTFKMLAKSFKLATRYCVKHQLCVSMNVRWPMCNVCWVLYDICNLTALANIRIRYSYNCIWYYWCSERLIWSNISISVFSTSWKYFQKRAFVKCECHLQNRKQQWDNNTLSRLAHCTSSVQHLTECHLGHRYSLIFLLQFIGRLKEV